MVVLTNSRFISHRPERFEGRMPDHPVVSHVSVSNLCLVPWFHPRRVFLTRRPGQYRPLVESRAWRVRVRACERLIESLPFAKAASWSMPGASAPDGITRPRGRF